MKEQEESISKAERELPVDPPTLLGSARAFPMLVCVDGRTVGDAVVIVSPSDPNFWHYRRERCETDGVVTVRRKE